MTTIAESQIAAVMTAIASVDGVTNVRQSRGRTINFTSPAVDGEPPRTGSLSLDTGEVLTVGAEGFVSVATLETFDRVREAVARAACAAAPVASPDALPAEALRAYAAARGAVEEAREGLSAPSPDRKTVVAALWAAIVAIEGPAGYVPPAPSGHELAEIYRNAALVLRGGRVAWSEGCGPRVDDAIAIVASRWFVSRVDATFGPLAKSLGIGHHDPDVYPVGSLSACLRWSTCMRRTPDHVAEALERAAGQIDPLKSAR